MSLSTATLSIDRDFAYEEPVIGLSVFNEDGLRVAMISDADRDALDLPAAVKYLRRDVSGLYEKVEAAVYKYEKTASDVLKELGQLERQKVS